MAVENTFLVVLIFACATASPEDFVRKARGDFTSRRQLQDSLRGGRPPNCPIGYRDRTGGHAFWWSCVRDCVGNEKWSTADCQCACIPEKDFASITIANTASISSSSARPSIAMPASTVPLTSVAPVTTSQDSRRHIVTSTSGFLAVKASKEISPASFRYMPQALTTPLVVNGLRSIRLTPPPKQNMNAEQTRERGSGPTTIIFIFFGASIGCVICCAAVGFCVGKYFDVLVSRSPPKSCWEGHAQASALEGRQKVCGRGSKRSRVHPDRDMATRMSKSVVSAQSHKHLPRMHNFTPQPSLKLTIPAHCDSSTCTPSRTGSDLSASTRGSSTSPSV